MSGPILDHWNPELGSPGDDQSAGAENTERKRMWDYYTSRLILILGATSRTRGDMQLIWARHASAIIDKREGAK